MPKEICPLLPTSFSAAGLRQPRPDALIVLHESLRFVWHQLSNGKAELTAGYLPLGSDHQCDALLALAAFAALPQVDQIDEPRGLEPLWWRLAGLAEVAPKRWLDADLVAFAISGSLRQISLDRDVQPFLKAGIDLELLQADAGSGEGGS